jgi:hypothetical protein
MFDDVEQLKKNMMARIYQDLVARDGQTNFNDDAWLGDCERFKRKAELAAALFYKDYDKDE